jgi:hypothetical protein
MDISEFGLQAVPGSRIQAGPRFYMRYLEQVCFLSCRGAEIAFRVTVIILSREQMAKSRMTRPSIDERNTTAFVVPGHHTQA